MGRQCVTPCFLTLAHDPFLQQPREYGSGTMYLPTHLWPVPFGTQGIQWGCLRTHRLLYHPSLLPFAAPPLVRRLCRWSRLHSVWRRGSRAQFDSATRFSTPGDLHYSAPGLVCSDRPEGRLHSCFDPSVTQTVPMVCVRGSGMVVQGPPPRALPVSPCLYPAMGSGRQGPQLPRRLAYLGPIQRAVVRSQGLGASAPQPVGASGQLRKEQALWHPYLWNPHVWLLDGTRQTWAVYRRQWWRPSLRVELLQQGKPMHWSGVCSRTGVLLAEKTPEDALHGSWSQSWWQEVTIPLWKLKIKLPAATNQNIRKPSVIIVRVLSPRFVAGYIPIVQAFRNENKNQQNQQQNILSE